MKTLQHQRICLQVYRIVQDLVKLGSWLAFKETDSDFWLFAIITAHWAFLGFNVEEEDGFTSFYVGVGLFLVSDAVFIFTSVLKAVRRYLSMKDCVKNTEFGAGVLSLVRWVVSRLKGMETTPSLTCLGLDSCIVSRMFLSEKKLTNIK